jgi:glycosyltransferase involved in cell wall biosynthesis
LQRSSVYSTSLDRCLLSCSHKCPTCPSPNTFLLSLILTYYDRPFFLQQQVSEWVRYSVTSQKSLEIIIVDDGSGVNASQTLHKLLLQHKNAQNLNIIVYRILCDIPFNQGGARNLGAHLARSKWLLLIDIDTVVTKENLELALDVIANNEPNVAYQLNRKLSHSTLFSRLFHNGNKIHPNSFLLPKKIFWGAGGVEEDFCGSYGHDDSNFRTRLNSFVDVTQLNDFLLMEIPPSKPKTEPDRDTTRNEILFNEIAQHKRNHSNLFLRFPWVMSYDTKCKL